MYNKPIDKALLKNSAKGIKRSLALLLFLTFFIPATSSAQEKPRNKFALSGFSGGMMLHTGWLWGGSVALRTPQGTSLSPVDMYGTPFGIGGVLRFHFGKHFRIGTEGYSTTLKYGDYSSEFKIGWGGLLADYQWHCGKFYPYAGVTIGGGAASNLTLTHTVEDDFETETNTSYRKYGFMAVAPFAGVEYALNSKIRLVLKADWLLNASNPQPDFPTGPRIYFGIIFSHVSHRR